MIICFKRKGKNYFIKESKEWGYMEWNIKRNFRLISNISQCQILLYLLFLLLFSMLLIVRITLWGYKNVSVSLFFCS